LESLRLLRYSGLSVLEYQDALNAIGVCIGAIVLVAKVKKRRERAESETTPLGPEKPRRPVMRLLI
jgi:hypothetical protein